MSSGFFNHFRTTSGTLRLSTLDDGTRRIEIVMPFLDRITVDVDDLRIELVEHEVPIQDEAVPPPG